MVDMRVRLVTSKIQEITNMAYINPSNLGGYKVIEKTWKSRVVHVAQINGYFVVRLWADETLGQDEIALNKMQCEYAKTWRECVATVERFELPNDIRMVALYVELQTTSGHPSQINATTLEKQLKKSFHRQIMHVGQGVQFKYSGVPDMIYTVNRVIMSGNEGVSRSGIRGMLSKKTKIFFDPLTENLAIYNQPMVPGRIFRRDIDPQEAENQLKALGVGGMGRTFSDLYTRVFATRAMEPNLLERLGITHAKGILLYGPPGTGKTLFMRVLSKVLYAREPKLVNGPQLMSKWFGESEENIRKIFNDAIKDYRKYGESSPLHIIVFDEIDSIAQRRGEAHNGSDRVVSQLLTMIDGVNKLNNILIVGTTNRKDLIDDALLRQGRLGIHIEIGLPNHEARLNILDVHTEKMRQCGMLDSDVDLIEIDVSWQYGSIGCVMGGNTAGSKWCPVEQSRQRIPGCTLMPGCGPADPTRAAAQWTRCMHALCAIAHAPAGLPRLLGNRCMPAYACPQGPVACMSNQCKINGIDNNYLTCY